MLTRIKHYILIAAAIGAFYYLLSHHFIMTSWTDFDVLEKSELTLANTFCSVKQVSPEQLLGMEDLREAGIGEWMVERGMLTQQKLDYILRKLDADQ